MQILILLFLTFFIDFSSVKADKCIDCVSQKNVYCVDNSTCVSSTTLAGCSTPIHTALNCPASPQYGYDDMLVRSQMMTITTAAQNENPQLCFNNQIPSMKLFEIRSVNCSHHFTDVTCVGFTAYDRSQKIIVISFKGAHGEDQMKQLMEEILLRGATKFFDSGRVIEPLYSSFLLLWNGGMSQDLRNLKYKYPDYKLWVNGHSLGSAFGILASSYIAKSGLYKPEDMKVVTMGTMVTGDYDFAVWHTNTFPYSFHVVHRDDMATKGPVHDPIHGETYWHPRTRVWYDNYMKLGDPYIICQEADGYCSDTAKNSTFMDHLYYFNVQLPLWGHAGCPKNISAYAQPEN